jgi:hypothetical protein
VVILCPAYFNSLRIYHSKKSVRITNDRTPHKIFSSLMPRSIT